MATCYGTTKCTKLLSGTMSDSNLKIVPPCGVAMGFTFCPAEFRKSPILYHFFPLLIFLILIAVVIGSFGKTQCARCPSYAPYISGSTCVKTCPVGTKCQSGCPKSLPLIYNQQCMASCPSGTFELGNGCVAACPKGFASLGNKCVDNCPSGTVLRARTTECISSCPQLLYPKAVDGNYSLPAVPGEQPVVVSSGPCSSAFKMPTTRLDTNRLDTCCFFCAPFDLQSIDDGGKIVCRIPNRDGTIGEFLGWYYATVF